MNILLTGAGSFTGYWFVTALAAAGHRVVAPLRGQLCDYIEIRRERVQRLAAHATVVERCPFGSPAFLDLVQRERFDILAHHAAVTAGYRSADFDVVGAVAENTRELPGVLRQLRDGGLKGVVLTGSVFEQDEGVGNAPMAAFSPYGLSKGLTAQIFRFWCGKLGIPLGKFVIPNPFGPFEEPRFCHYVIRAWLAGQTPTVRTPRYVRDNIHVSLLAALYSGFVTCVGEAGVLMTLRPSLYAESQGAFAQRLAQELGPRLGVPTPIEFAEQRDFPEPMVRINTDISDFAALGWSESGAWDSIAAHYLGAAAVGDAV